MKHTLDLNSYNSYNSNLLFFNSLLESDSISNKGDLKSEEKKEFSKWQKIISWIKINKTPIVISIGSIVVVSIIISLYMKILKYQQYVDDKFADAVKDIGTVKDVPVKDTDVDIKKYIDEFKKLRIPIRRNSFNQVPIINDFIDKYNLNYNNKEHKKYIDKLINAINFKIKTGQDIDDWLKDINDYENILKTDVGVKYDNTKPPLTWDRSDESWKIQTQLYDKINQLSYYSEKFKDDYPALNNILDDMKFGEINKAINGIKMSYFGKERNIKINNLDKLLNFVHDSMLNIYRERDNIQKLLN